MSQVLPRMRGATYPAVTDRDVLEAEIPIPPPSEQQEIVTRIRECMTRVEEIKALNSENDDLHIHLFRAVRREWLGSSYDIPVGWKEQRLDHLADVIYGISEAISSNRDPAIGPPIIRMANISLEGRLDLSDLRYCAIPKGKEQHFLLRRGDLLLNWRSGSSEHIGKTAIFDSDGDFTCASFILRIRAKEGLADARFLRHVLNHMRAEGIFSGFARMQINHKLNAAEFSAFKIRVPMTLAEQERIADQLDAAESIIVKLEAGGDGKREHVLALHLAILRRALAGEL